MPKAANPPSHKQARPAHKWPLIGANVHTTWESGKRVSAVFFSRRDYPRRAELFTERRQVVLD